MSYHYAPLPAASTSSSSSQPSITNRYHSSSLTSRTGKRSFDEYGRSDPQPTSSSQLTAIAMSAPPAAPSMNHSQPRATSGVSSSMADASNPNNLSLNPTDSIIMDISNDTTADSQSNGRSKRRRSSSHSQNTLASPPMPVDSSFLNIPNPTTTEHSMESQPDSFMSWNTNQVPNSPPLFQQPASSDREGQSGRGSLSRILERSLQTPDPWQIPPPNLPPYGMANRDNNSNRMSWVSDAPINPYNDTVTTNTEPGWNLNSSSTNSNARNLGPSSIEQEQNMYLNEPQTVHSTTISSSTRPNIQLVPTTMQSFNHHNANSSSGSSLEFMPSPQSAEYPGTSSYSRNSIEFSNWQPPTRFARAPSPEELFSRPPENQLSNSAENPNNLPWLPTSWRYEETRVPPPPTQSPPAPPPPHNHAASVPSNTYFLPSASINTSENALNSTRPRAPPARRPSSGWDFLDSPANEFQFRITPDYELYPSPTEERPRGADAASTISGGTPTREWPPFGQSFGAGNRSSTYEAQRSAGTSDSDSTMDLHRLLTRHTGLGMDRFAEMAMPRAHEHPLSASSYTSHTAMNSGQDNRRVRFPETVYHQAPSSSLGARVVSPPPPPTSASSSNHRRAPSIPWHSFLGRRRNEPEPTPGTAAAAAPASSHVRSTSDTSQMQYSSTPFNGPGASRYNRSNEMTDTWRDGLNLYPSSIPARLPEPDMFAPYRLHDLGMENSREPTPRPLGARLRESISGTGGLTRRTSGYGHGDVDNGYLHFAERERERQDLDNLLNRPRHTRSNSTSSTGLWGRDRRTSLNMNDGYSGLPPLPLPPHSHISHPPPTTMSRASRGPLSSLAAHLVGIAGSSAVPPVRVPTPTPSSPSSTSPPSPPTRLPFVPDIPHIRPPPSYAVPSLSTTSGTGIGLSRRGLRRNNGGRNNLSPTDYALASWLDDMPDSPTLFRDVEDDSAFLPTSSRARRRLRTARDTMLALGRIRSMGDYVLDDDFDDSYEALLALEQIIGPAKKGCSVELLKNLTEGTFAKLSGDAEQKLAIDERCAICLDEYEKEQTCVKLPKCPHIYHKDCILGWLKTANTCPVCRESVEDSSRQEARAPSPPRRSIGNLARARHIGLLRDTSGPSTSITGTGTSGSNRRRGRRSNNQTNAPSAALEDPFSPGSSRRDNGLGHRRGLSDGLSLDLGLLQRSSTLYRRHDSGEASPDGIGQSPRGLPSPSRINASSPRFIRGPFTRWLAGETDAAPTVPGFH